MKKYLKPNFYRWKNDYNFKTIVNSIGAFFITSVFALYNGFLGLWYKSVWNGGICLYYLFLAILRGIILISEKKNLNKDITEIDKYRKKIFRWTSIILLLLNFSLVVPITLMILNKRPVNMGMIPAITMATYTTYKLVISSTNIKKMKRSVNILVRELRTINFIDALVSILTLQNTLIIVNQNTGSKKMFILSVISSTAIFSVIAFISVRIILKNNKKKVPN